MTTHAGWFRQFGRWFFNTSVEWTPLDCCEPGSLSRGTVPFDALQRRTATDSSFSGSFMSQSKQPKPETVHESGEHRAEPDKAVDHTRSGESSQPALPNDRDESMGATGGIQSPSVQQAHRDTERGLKDTSRGLESDKAYEKLKK